MARGSACSYPSAVQSCPTVAPDALHRASVVSRAQLARRRKIPILIGSPPVSSASQSSIQRQRDAMQLSSSFSVKASDRRAGNGHDSRCVVSCRSKCNSWFDFIFPQATPSHAVTSLKIKVPHLGTSSQAFALAVCLALSCCLLPPLSA